MRLPTLILDRASYPVGSFLQFRLAGEPLAGKASISVHRPGESRPFMRKTLNLNGGNDTFSKLWEIPPDASTGRYQVRFAISGALPPVVASFAVFRSELTIDDFRASQRFYSAGDAVSFSLCVTNHTSQPRRNLRAVVAESQYPWILPSRDSGQAVAFAPAQTIDLEPGETKKLSFTGQLGAATENAAVQYTAVLESGRPGQIASFRSAPPLFVRIAEEALSPIYPASFIHSDLRQLRTSGYRRFYADKPPEAFDLDRTSFSANASSEVSVNLPGGEQDLRVILELRSADGALIDRSEALKDKDRAFTRLHFGGPGHYALNTRFEGPGGHLVCSESLEVSANHLPRALAIVCAHPDDEFLHPAVLRAAVENGIPVHLIFLTCGDAGGSERFFGSDYSPAEAIEFGHIRMAEARAAAAHLGLSSEHLHFMGLPDGFLETIRTEAGTFKPVFSPILGVDHAPYRELRRPNLRFQKHAVVRELADLLAAIDPDVVYTSHPDERHADHKAAALFTIEALQRLVAERRLTSQPVLRVDRFYGGASADPEPFAYAAHEFYASAESMARVQEAYWFYQSQGGNHARGHVLSYAALPRTEHHQEVLDWAEASAPQLPAAV